LSEPPLRIEKLQRAHEVEGFDCGKEALNRFLLRYALQNQQAGASQTYIAIAGNSEIAGYYTLVVGQVSYETAPERLTKGLARHPVPIMLLARLAIGEGWQGKGLGSGLLKDAMMRTLQAAEIKDDQAKAFYEKFDFVPSPTDPYHLYLLLKDVRALLA
jgi:GNAT superfamily N-acetyltransferase